MAMIIYIYKETYRYIHRRKKIQQNYKVKEKPKI